MNAAVIVLKSETGGGFTIEPNERHSPGHVVRPVGNTNVNLSSSADFNHRRRRRSSVDENLETNDWGDDYDDDEDVDDEYEDTAKTVNDYDDGEFEELKV